MSDEELTELAAKAFGLDEYELQFWGFDPLNEDADAFRLAVKLKMSMVLESFGFLGPATWVRAPGSQKTEYHEQDPCAATRRAIVRAAAEIGRGMK